MEFKELDKIIREIYRYYQEIRNGWMKCNDYQQINLSKKFVIDVMDSSRCPELLQVIFNHRAFLFENVVSISILLAIENCESRVKNQNSLESKLATYCGQNHENGEIALKKCVLNLLYRFTLPRCISLLVFFMRFLVALFIFRIPNL